MKAANGKAREVDVLIIGAGHNGLVAGSYLARAGLEVQVLERRSIVGGACVTEELFPGFHFSSCSFMLYALHPRIAEDLELHRYGFEVFQLEPFAFRPYPDGRYLVLHQDPERNAEAISAFSRRDAESYRRWNRFWERFHSIVHPYVLTPPPTYPDLVGRARETGNLEIFKKSPDHQPRRSRRGVFRVGACPGRGDPFRRPWRPPLHRQLPAGGVPAGRRGTGTAHRRHRQGGGWAPSRGPWPVI